MSIDVDVDSIKDFNSDNTLIIITYYVLDFDNSDNTLIALKVFDESLAENKRYQDLTMLDLLVLE